jgi:hypothetical protein
MGNQSTKFDHECPEVVSESGTGGSKPPADGIIDLVRPVVAFLKVCRFVLRKFGSERAYFATGDGGVAR